MKRLIPSGIRLNIKLIQRFVRDKQSSLVFAQKRQSTPEFLFFVSETQPIKQSEYFQNKIDNIELGAKFIEEVIIEPGETISFWKAIGKPTQKRGFKVGRNLINGKLTADYGGGLCQLSGIMYITALKSGLDIIERHNHTVDIYKEEERFTPLGSDATIVYAYKDLRIKNTFPHPIRFVFIVSDNSIECRLMSIKQIEPKTIDFIRTEKKGGVTVETFRDNVACDVSYYLQN